MTYISNNKKSELATMAMIAVIANDPSITLSQLIKVFHYARYQLKGHKGNEIMKKNKIITQTLNKGGIHVVSSKNY